MTHRKTYRSSVKQKVIDDCIHECYYRKFHNVNHMIVPSKLFVSAAWVLAAQGLMVSVAFAQSNPLPIPASFESLLQRAPVVEGMCSAGDVQKEPIVSSEGIMPDDEDENEIVQEALTAPAPAETVPATVTKEKPVPVVPIVKKSVPSRPVVAARHSSSGGGIGKRGPIAAKTKKVDGKRVCAMKHSHPSKSDKNKKGHIDAECCLDPDETPNSRCFYTAQFQHMIDKYLQRQNKKNKK